MIALNGNRFSSMGSLLMGTKGQRTRPGQNGRPIKTPSQKTQKKERITSPGEEAADVDTEGEVVCKVSEKGGIIEFRIRNTGPEIAADLGEAIFDRFFRGDKSSDIPGTGLGLSLARLVAQQHRGERSTPGLSAALRWAGSCRQSRAASTDRDFGHAIIRNVQPETGGRGSGRNGQRALADRDSRLCRLSRRRRVVLPRKRRPFQPGAAHDPCFGPPGIPR